MRSNDESALAISDSVSDGTSLSLLERVKGHDEEAWQRFFDLYGPVIFHWCRHCGLQPVDAEDVSQDVFLAVKRSIWSFRRDRAGDSFCGWLWTIVRNRINDFLGRQNRTPQPVGGSTANQLMGQIPEKPPCVEEPENAFLDAVAQRALALLQSEFEERTWRAFWRTAIDGQSAKDVAAELGMKSHAVHQARYRVLHRLREELDGLHD
jgi:RNA polymerase sigma-70 factor, ECF subfamily